MSELVLAGVILSGVWTQLDEVGWIGWVPLVLVALLDRFYPSRIGSWPRFPPAPAERGALLAAAALCALLLAHLALTFREEFGFGGDEGYHLSATRMFALYFMRAGPLLVGVAVVYAFLKLRSVQYASTIAMAALIAASYALPDSKLFARYPAGFYLIATPLNVLFDVVNSPYPYSANHVMNTLSVPAWLFILRPLLIGRWPDWQVLPAALLVYFQAPALTYLGSTLIEPWSIVCLLLALEILVTWPPQDRWVALAFGVAAAAIKETAVLFLPTIWLMACVEWRAGLPRLRRNALAAGVASIVPFAVYYVLRLDADIQRVVGIATADQIWQMSRVSLWFSNVTAALGLSALGAAAAAFLITLRHPAWGLTTLGVIAFLFVDAMGVPYTGYNRYLSFAMVALCGAVFATTHRITDRRMLIALSIALASLQAVPFGRALALDFQPDYARNSLEWNGSLIRLPIRSLAGRVPGLPGGELARRLRVVTFGTDLTSLSVAYPDLAARYELIRGDLGNGECGCRDNSEAVLAAFEWPAHLGDTADATARFTAASSACVRQIEETCQVHVSENERGGATVGVLGLGRR